VECLFWSVWVVLGDAETGFRFAHLLVVYGEGGSVAVWKMVPTCFFWCLWRERNNKSFEDLEGSLEDILSSCFHTLYLWTVAHVFPVSISYNDFLVHFSLSS
jgi:hypothetical protein